MTSPAPTDVMLSALLRRNAHQLRNRVTALLSAIDAVEAMSAASSETRDEAVEILTETSNDLCELANGWTADARALFSEHRGRIEACELAEAAEAELGLEIACEAGAEAAIAADRRILGALLARIAGAGPTRAALDVDERHGVEWLTLAVELAPSSGAALLASEPVRALLDRLGAQARAEEDGRLLVRMPVKAAGPAATAAPSL